jgi:hypothetical protein
VGQQPNIELETADLPRPTDHPGTPRRWAPGRAGELSGPDDVPRGGRFGNPGPDAGYALTLLSDREIPLGDGEHRADAVAAIAAVMSARAASFGRAPMVGDAEVAEVILGYAGPSADAAAGKRAAAIAGLAHHAAGSRSLVAAVDQSALGASLEDVTRRAASGETLLDL